MSADAVRLGPDDFRLESEVGVRDVVEFEPLAGAEFAVVALQEGLSEPLGRRADLPEVVWLSHHFREAVLHEVLSTVSYSA